MILHYININYLEQTIYRIRTEYLQFFNSQPVVNIVIFINYIIHGIHVSDKNVPCHANSYYNYALPDPRSLSPFFIFFERQTTSVFACCWVMNKMRMCRLLRFIPEII